MTGASAAIGHDGRGALHHRLPIGIGHIGNEHVPGAHSGHFLHVADDARGSRADALTDRTAARHHASLLTLQCISLNRAPGAALYRLRTRLQDVDLARLAILAPLDIHRTAVVLLDGECLSCKLEHILIRDGELASIRFGDVDGYGALAAAGFAVDHLDGLATHRASDDRVSIRTHRGFVHVELIRIHGALHDRFAQSIRGGDEHDVAEAGIGVEREHHAACAQIRTHHELDAC